MKNKVIILPIEKHDQRYTEQWYTELPKMLQARMTELELDMDIISIDGKLESQSNKVTKGAFLNFTETNKWKNDQINVLADMFSRGEVSPGDKILITDAWNSGIIQIKYMSDLLDIPVEIHSIWHAGSYDPNDFLGRKIKNKNWSRIFECSIFHTSDYNYFASYYHVNLFAKGLGFYTDEGLVFKEKFFRSGFPFEYLKDTLEPYKNLPKEDIILFPHRIAPEKQPNIFLDLKESLPEYKFIVCQEEHLTKDEYHTLLGKSKMVFSANLQETLGISCYEGALVNALPLVPDRLSYSEMYSELFKYASYVTDSWDEYLRHKELLVSRIKYMMNSYDMLVKSHEFSKMVDKLSDHYFNSKMLITNILISNK